MEVLPGCNDFFYTSIRVFNNMRMHSLFYTLLRPHWSANGLAAWDYKKVDSALLLCISDFSFQYLHKLYLCYLAQRLNGRCQALRVMAGSS